MNQQLIARFIFNEGDPIDVRFAQDKKEDFLKAIEHKNVYLDSESNAAFWPNMNHVKCFFVMDAPPEVSEKDVLNDKSSSSKSK